MLWESFSSYYRRPLRCYTKVRVSAWAIESNARRGSTHTKCRQESLSSLEFDQQSLYCWIRDSGPNQITRYSMDLLPPQSKDAAYASNPVKGSPATSSVFAKVHFKASLPSAQVLNGSPLRLCRSGCRTWRQLLHRAIERCVKLERTRDFWNRIKGGASTSYDYGAVIEQSPYQSLIDSYRLDLAKPYFERMGCK